MSLQVNLPSQAITTTNTTIRLKMLPLNTRTPSTTTVTVAAAGTNVNVTVNAAAVRGATSITVNAVSAALPNRARIRFANGAQAILSAAVASGATTLPVMFLSADVTSGLTGIWNAGSLSIGSMYVPVNPLVEEIDAGEILAFNTTNMVTVTDYCPAGSTVLEVLPLTTAVVANQTATTQSLLTVAGATDATPTSAPKTVDATTYNSGVGKEMLVTGVSATLKIGYNLIVGDRGGDVINSLLYNPANFNREVYAVVSRPFDGVYEGAAIVTNNSDTAPVQDLAKRTADMQFQGTSFKFTKFATF